jgi:HPt (histidine-containing phosphotransfer) domain-containing protein/CheY-like chemotaxis protein
VNKLRILLVDADADRLEQVSVSLEEAEHTVLPVTSLEEAEEALFVRKIDVAIFGSPFDRVEMEIFVERLRGIENTQKNAPRTPVLAVDESVPAFPGWTSGADGVIDGHLTAEFNSEILWAVIAAVEGTGPSSVAEKAQEAGIKNLPLFEPEKFRQQVAYDPELTVEIIQLFLEEQSVEIPEMREALDQGEFQRLSDVAHTIKGSLSSLHATLARHHAQALESAAKNRDGAACRANLQALADDLGALEPLLLKLQDEVQQ